MPAAVLLGRDPTRLRRLLGINVAPQVGSIFNEAVGDNTVKRWNGVPARRTTQSDATNHRRYAVTRKRLDAAGCTGEPRLVIVGNRVFLCILPGCMAFRRLFVAILEAQVGNHPPHVAGEVHKVLYRNQLACGWGRTTHRTGRRPTTSSGPGRRLSRCLHTSRRTPRGQRSWGSEYCYALCTRQF